MDYIAIKHTHVLFAVLSILLFFTRAISRLATGKIAANKGVFITSHSVDTLLLISAFALLAIGKINPIDQPWLIEKIILVVAYIVLGIVSAKASTRTLQVGTLVAVVFSLLGIGYLAGTKSALIL
ncbi:hypothetical protein PSECIP111951_03801 [Pseudoalteromonas holothuriae]|uniref:Transcriptional regulator n=1 Tax=Pseudoalteromonas holothuriae TaxID=2963714 RepID=A0A9W4QQY0_9GAMM|nr:MULTISPECIES: SirB2 family protein [unclassified Pseudoalteromonas]CAH9049533.1 hypothetical protein PSECIP111854_00175 [Pseudoalteromonas sp. CIP111854]CAH9067467.1 hypothetical protein PSECIP111951_03801 [Pseudoalteromonas sp. CIP111951]